MIDCRLVNRVNEKEKRTSCARLTFWGEYGGLVTPTFEGTDLVCYGRKLLPAL